jgi:hypothetical protein
MVIAAGFVAAWAPLYEVIEMNGQHKPIPKMDIALGILCVGYTLCAFVGAWRHEVWSIISFGAMASFFFVMGGFSIGRNELF